VHDARFPSHFGAPGNIIKYNGKTNPSAWLEDYRFMCIVGGANSAGAWLDDLLEILTDNCHGAYMPPGNPWDLKGYRQKMGKSLPDYIRRLSQKFHELPSVADADVILLFWDSMTCRTLVHEVSREQPKTTKELLGITTQHTSGEEVVGAAFVLANARMTSSSG
jgi:hypothetical protein